MPFVILHGIPNDLSDEYLIELRRGIVDLVSREMDVPMRHVRPFCPVDRFPEPRDSEDGARTIYVSLDTALFHDKEDADSLAKEVAAALCEYLWSFFTRKYEVEVFVHDLNPAWKHLKKAVL